MVIGGVLAGLLGALVLALGAQYQNRGVDDVNRGRDDRADAGFSPRQLLTLLRSRAWLGGSGLLTAAIVLQLVGLLLAPLPVVQPLGVLSLVATALLNRRLGGMRMHRTGVAGIGLCVAGTVVLVLTAALTTRSTPGGAAAVVPVLVLLVVVLAVVGGGFLALRRRLPAVAFAVGGGICFGFVATLMKAVLDRCRQALEQHGTLFDAGAPFTLLVVAGVAAAGLVGMYLVQTAYSSGSPDIVVAALAVIDPLVAVTVGIAALGAARGAPVGVFPVFAAAEAVAVAGVVLMSRFPPTPADG